MVVGFEVETWFWALMSPMGPDVISRSERISSHAAHERRDLGREQALGCPPERLGGCPVLYVERRAHRREAPQ
jgi:hypothetical protein